MIRSFLAMLEYPWLAAVAVVLACAAIPALVRFYYGESRDEIARELGLGDPLQRQVTLLSVLVYGRWWSLRAVTFVGSFVIVAGAIDLVLARMAGLSD